MKTVRKLPAQRGVTLIVAMVMLVIIGLTSAAVMRGSMTTDRVANNARVQTLAWQAAQIGLRVCEAQVMLATTARTITIYPAAATPAAQRWKTFSNWFGSGAVATRLNTAQMSTSSSSFTPATLPQCMIERSGLTNVYIVTSRGFSPDYAEDTAGRSTAGSVVWLQSTLSGLP